MPENARLFKLAKEKIKEKSEFGAAEDESGLHDGEIVEGDEEDDDADDENEADGEAGADDSVDTTAAVRPNKKARVPAAALSRAGGAAGGAGRDRARLRRGPGARDEPVPRRRLSRALPPVQRR